MSDDGQYLCWSCGLRYGDESAPELPAQLCPSCIARSNVTSKPFALQSFTFE